MLKLKLQYFGRLMWRTDSFEKTLMHGRWKVEEEGDHRGWDGCMASPTRWTWVWVNSGSSWWTGKSGVLQSMGSHRVGHNWVTELNWTESCPGTRVPTCNHAPSPLWFWPAGLWLGSVPNSAWFLLKGGRSARASSPGIPDCLPILGISSLLLMEYPILPTGQASDLLLLPWFSLALSFSLSMPSPP